VVFRGDAVVVLPVFFERTVYLILLRLPSRIDGTYRPTPRDCPSSLSFWSLVLLLDSNSEGAGQPEIMAERPVECSHDVL